MKNELKKPIKILSKQIGISYNNISRAVKKSVGTSYASKADIMKVISKLIKS
jgi:hypothetical protein